MHLNSNIPPKIGVQPKAYVKRMIQSTKLGNNSTLRKINKL